MRRSLLPLLALLAAPVYADPELVITVHWYPRPPLQFIEDGKLRGTMIDPTISALRAAGIAYRLNETPASRILLVIKANQGMDCSPGWFRSAEREEYGQFTGPILREPPLVVVVRKNDFPGAEQQGAANFFRRSGLRFLWKQDFTYGPFFGKLINELIPPEQLEKTSADPPIVLKMIKAGRADATIMSPGEIDYLSRTQFSPDDFRKLTFADSPPGENRYLLCSKKVPAGILSRLNAALTK